ncbi:formyl transferase domain protein [Actinobacteria bacterium OK006]|nr:formyl transferase domain protein [Actinobacteria bacterium OK006]
MVSKFGHCLNDLLLRRRTGALNIEIPAIVSHHRDFESLAETYGVEGHAINIHHSLLPGFKGARPYEQAYARGAKLVDATVR